MSCSISRVRSANCPPNTAFPPGPDVWGPGRARADRGAAPQERVGAPALRPGPPGPPHVRPRREGGVGLPRELPGRAEAPCALLPAPLPRLQAAREGRAGTGLLAPHSAEGLARPVCEPADRLL